MSERKYRLILIAEAHSDEENDYTIIRDSNRKPWVEIGGTTPFVADETQAESLRAGITDYALGAGVELGG